MADGRPEDDQRAAPAQIHDGGIPEALVVDRPNRAGTAAPDNPVLRRPAGDNRGAPPPVCRDRSRDRIASQRSPSSRVRCAVVPELTVVEVVGIQEPAGGEGPRRVIVRLSDGSVGHGLSYLLRLGTAAPEHD